LVEEQTMTQVVLDANMRNKLRNLTQPLELCDEAGTILARLVPVLDESQYERVEPPPLSAEELERRRQEPDFSTEELLKHLESL
jgi:hypothetical protein